MCINGGRGMMGKGMMGCGTGQGDMCQMMNGGGMTRGQARMNGLGMPCPMMGGVINQANPPKNSFEMFKGIMMKQEPVMDDKMMEDFIKSMKEDKAFFEKFKGMINK